MCHTNMIKELNGKKNRMTTVIEIHLCGQHKVESSITNHPIVNNGGNRIYIMLRSDLSFQSQSLIIQSLIF